MMIWVIEFLLTLVRRLFGDGSVMPPGLARLFGDGSV